MIADIDKDGSGTIDFEEFLQMMTAKMGERDSKVSCRGGNMVCVTCAAGQLCIPAIPILAVGRRRLSAIY